MQVSYALYNKFSFIHIFRAPINPLYILDKVRKHCVCACVHHGQVSCSKLCCKLSVSVTTGKDIIKTQFIFQQVSIANMTEVQATQHFQWCDLVMWLKSQPVACPKDFSSVG